MTCIIISDINDISDLPEYSGIIFNDASSLPGWTSDMYYGNSYNFYKAIENSKIFINNEFDNILINICKCIKNKYLLIELLLKFDNDLITKIILHGLSIFYRDLNFIKIKSNPYKLLLLASMINLLDLINDYNLEIDELLYITLIIYYYIKKNKMCHSNFFSTNIIFFENNIIDERKEYKIHPLYIIIYNLIKYDKYINISLTKIVNKNKNFELNIKELVEKNNKLESIVEELVNKDNNIEELRNEINVYKIIVNNLITNK